MNSKIVAILAAVILSGCGETPFEAEEKRLVAEMEWLYTADPNDDFQDALTRNDLRLIGLYGAGTYIPGLFYECQVDESKVKYIEGTSDAVYGYEHSKLIAIAQTYAEHYNSLLQIYLDDQKVSVCNS